MSLCILVDSNNKASVELVDSVQLCSGYYVPPASEYQSIFDFTLQFNSELFNLVVGVLLITFITGHSAGRIVRWLGKK